MREALNWDEFRLVRAIAEAQSLSGAAERVGLNASTLFRRLAALEARLGVKLFERERAGYRPTAAGEDMAALAGLIGDTIGEFERRVAAEDVKLSGRVRVATLASLGALVMPGICVELAALHPALHIELHCAEGSLDALQVEADIAIRCLKAAPAGFANVRRVAPMPWALYAAEGTAVTSALGPVWIAPCDSFGPPLARQWIERHVEPWRLAASASNEMVMAELAARGLGAALLPCYVAACKPQLRRIGEADPELDGDLWLIATERGGRTPRVRAAFEFIGDALERRRPWFEGERVVGA